MSYMALKNQKRIINILIGCGILALILLSRLIYIQVIKSKHYEEKAYEQQTRQRSVAAKRGTIYDATGEKVLAQSVSVNIVTAVPNSVDKDKKDEIATKIAEILEINKDDVLAKLSKNSSSETIATKVDEDKATKLLSYISDEQISGIRVDEDTKRVYPYSTLLANVLGFVGTDNVGLEGIEAYYNSDLAGIPGKIVGSTDGKGRETPFTNEQYVAPTDGKDIVLTIDATTGQNGISQAKSFQEITNITGIILTKLDGTAKGGIVLAIKDTTNIPVKFVGFGEKKEDLRVFDIEKYIYGLFKEMDE